jgi:hypothetical protein
VVPEASYELGFYRSIGPPFEAKMKLVLLLFFFNSFSRFAGGLTAREFFLRLLLLG